MFAGRSLVILLVSTVWAGCTAFGQGPIVPTGTPAPTMKTLDQVEARIPIPGGTTGLYATVGGSYYLTGDLTVGASGTGIDIRADNITIDLNGYSIITATGVSSNYGIYVNGNGNVTIRNGHVKGAVTYSGSAYSGTGFIDGILVQGNSNVRIENVSVSGVSSAGIFVEGSFPATTVISHCQVLISAGTGITAGGASSVDHCTALYCANAAINGGNTVNDSYGYCTGANNGVSGGNVSNSFGVSNTGTALAAYEQATNCYGESYGTTGNGLSAANSAVGCRGVAQGNGYGLTTGTASHCTGNSYGTGAGNGLVSNEANGCEGTAGGSGTGVKCAYTATNCRGTSGSGVGVSAVTATNCHGVSTSGSGLVATTANTCFGSTGGTAATSFGIDCSANGIATGCRTSVTSSSAVAVTLRAFIATSCVVSGGTIAINNKYNMP